MSLQKDDHRSSLFGPGREDRRGKRPSLANYSALDRDEIALTVVVHLAIPGRNHAFSVSILFSEKSVAENPKSLVGIHLRQLLRQVTVLRGVANMLS